MRFGYLKVGDKVVRRMGYNGPAMLMVVVHVDDDLLYCDQEPRVLAGLPLTELWQFDRQSGCEEDHEIGWGRRFGKSGTFLEPGQ